MFLEGTVGVCSCGSVAHVEDVVYVAAVPGGAIYTLKHGCQVIVDKVTHSDASRWLRAKADNDLAEPSDAELALIEFEIDLEHVETIEDLAALWTV